MDKKGGKGKGKVVTVNLTNKAVTRFNSKLFFVRSVDANMLLDANYVGKIVLSDPDNNRQVYQKFEFSSTETPGVYTMKSVLSGLFLSGDEVGNIFADVQDTYNSFQKWYILETTAGTYCIRNYSSNLAITVSLLNELYCRELPGSSKQKVLEGKEWKIVEVQGDIPSNMQWGLAMSR
jgi:hypothetical protein